MLQIAICLILNTAAPANADESNPNIRYIDETVGGHPVRVSYAAYPSNFSPGKPTIVYVPGGPMPFALSQLRPQGLPEGYQVLAIDYVGTSRDSKGFPSFSQSEVLQYFTSDKQAEVIRDIVKREDLKKYILWGQSHGVQVSLRAIDQIQRDPTIKVKPVSAILDSGMGRRATISDNAFKRTLGKVGQHGRCLHNQSEEDADRADRSSHPGPEISPATLESYVTLCGYNFTKADRARGTLADNLRRFSNSKRIQAQYGTSLSTKNLIDIFGCPPFDKIDYATWSSAISCGEFAPDLRVAMCLEFAPEEQRASCAKQPPCYESALDFRKYELGNTSVLGIQSMDDCNSWTKTMDDLMVGLVKRGNSAYLKLMNAGGHVTFANADAWQLCRTPSTMNAITSEIFAGNARKSSQLLRDCYRENAPGGVDCAVSREADSAK
ncbi:MAG: alpha/beta fold hydrolase [Bdellovibrionota bacterium]